MKSPNSELEKVLASLEEVPPRDSTMAGKGRARYLSEVDSVIAQDVSNRQNLRHINWKQKINYLFQARKEFVPMLTQIVSAILIAATLIAGGGGATVYASQNAMPGEVLYPVKTWSEDARLGITQNPTNQFELNLEFVNRRVEELIGLSEEEPGEIDDMVESQNRLMERLQLHIQKALNLVDELEEPELARTRLQTHLQAQNRLLEQRLQSVDPEFEPLMLRTRQMIQERLRLVEEELEPQQLQEQNQVQEQNQIRLATQAQTGKPEETGQGSNGPMGTPQGTPGNGYGPGPEETPTPGGQYGPGEQQTPVGPKNVGQPTQAPSEPGENGDNGGNGSGNGGKGGK